MKGNGDGKAWIGSYSKENTYNPGQNYTSGERY
jgi:hypothetical protein